MQIVVVKSFWAQGLMLYNIFRRSYITIGVSSVKILGKYAASGVNYTKKVLFYWLQEGENG
jgi:hypothetical protein